MLKDVIGFIGLGSQGKAMAKRLVLTGKFRVVVVWNRTSQVAADFKKEVDDARRKSPPNEDNNKARSSSRSANAGPAAGASPESSSTLVIVASTLAELWKHCQGGSIVSMLYDDLATEAVLTDLVRVGAKYDHDHVHHGDATLIVNCASITPECADRIGSLIAGRRRRSRMEGDHAVDAVKDKEHVRRGSTEQGARNGPSSHTRESKMDVEEQPEEEADLYAVHDMHFVNCALNGRPEHIAVGESKSWVSGENEDAINVCVEHIACAWSNTVRVISSTDSGASARYPN